MKKVILMVVAISLVGLGEVFAGDSKPYAKATKVEEVKTRKGLIPGIGELLFGSKKEKVEPKETTKMEKLAEKSSEIRKVPCTNGVCHPPKPKPPAPKVPEPPKYTPNIQTQPRYSYNPECFKPKYTYHRSKLPPVDVPVYVPSYDVEIVEQEFNYRRTEYRVPVKVYEAPTYRSVCEPVVISAPPPVQPIRVPPPVCPPTRIMPPPVFCPPPAPICPPDPCGPGFFAGGTSFHGGGYGYGYGSGRGFSAGRVQYHMPDPMPRR